VTPCLPAGRTSGTSRASASGRRPSSSAGCAGSSSSRASGSRSSRGCTSRGRRRRRGFFCGGALASICCVIFIGVTAGKECHAADEGHTDH